MPLAIRDDLAHVWNVLLVIFSRVFVRILLQNLNNLATTENIVSAMLATRDVSGLCDLSCPMDSPDPSLLLHPAPSEDSSFSHDSSSSELMLTSSLNSLGYGKQVYRQRSYKTVLNDRHVIFDHRRRRVIEASFRLIADQSQLFSRYWGFQTAVVLVL